MKNIRNNSWQGNGWALALFVIGIVAFLAIGAYLFYYAFIGTPENRLIYAASNGDIETIQVLLQRRVSINARDSKLGVTTLMSAVENHQTEVVRLLLNDGANVNIQDVRGNTALMGASLKGETAIVSDLLKQGAKVNIENDDAETAIFYAVVNGRTDIIKLLIESGADVRKKYYWEGESKSLLEIANDQKRKDIYVLLKNTALARASLTTATDSGKP